MAKTGMNMYYAESGAKPTVFTEQICKDCHTQNGITIPIIIPNSVLLIIIPASKHAWYT